MAPERTHLATETRVQRNATARRDALYPRFTYSAEAVPGSPVSHILHTVLEVGEENAKSAQHREIDGKMNIGNTHNNATSGHVDTTRKEASSCSKENVTRKQSRDARHNAEIDQTDGAEIIPHKGAHRPSTRLHAGTSALRALNTGVDDESPTDKSHRRLDQAQRRHQLTLDEPFTTYRRSRDGRLVVSEVPYRRRKFPLPGEKVVSILPKLRKLAMTETEQNRQRMILFAEGLDKFG